jgi:hypothetical protein
MICTMASATVAELIKLRTLSAVLAAAGGTVIAAAALSVAISASGGSADTGGVIAQSVRFVQVGLIVMGVLAVGTEFTGRAMRISLIATPNRMVLLASKAIAYLCAGAITSAAALGMGVLAARLAHTFGAGESAQATPWPLFLGAWMYLVLIGLLAFALTFLARSLIPPLVATLSLVLIVSPILKTLTPAAQFLPDQAGSALYHPESTTPLTPETGAAILLAWIAAIAAAAITVFRTQDA